MRVLALFHAILLVVMWLQVGTLLLHHVCGNILTTYSLECVLPAIAGYKVGCEIMPLLQQHCSEIVQDNDSQHFTTAPLHVWLVMSLDWNKHANLFSVRGDAWLKMHGCLLLQYF